MITTTDTARHGGIRHKLRRSEDWLDRKGKWAWITAMVLGFVVFWPLGLALLAYMIWGKQMFSKSCRHRDDRSFRHAYGWDRHGGRVMHTTGNSAFDDYKAQALRRLEEEQDAFETFLQRLRTSKDKTEFDAFMDDRARATAAQDEADTAADTGAKPETGARSGEY